MKRVLFLLFVSAFLFAKVDYSQMSNEELIALIGYVLPEHEKEFNEELKEREKSFNQNEIIKYQQAKEKKDDNSTS